MTACQETEEGCLDLLSTNYNFIAVSECNACCTYPNVTVNFRVDYGTFLSQALIDTFFLENRDSLILHDIQLSIGNFSYGAPDGPYRVLDSLQVGNNFIRDDYVLARLIIPYTIGQVRYAGETNMINFSVGIDADVVSTWGALDNIDQDSGLDNLLDSMYIAETQEVAMLRLRLQLEDSIRHLTITAPDAMNLSYPIDKKTELGENLIINLRVDLQVLTEGITSDMTNEQLEAIIIDKLASGIAIE